MLSQFKQRPIATGIFVVYAVFWLWLAYIAFYDYTNYGNGEAFRMSLYYAMWLFTLYFLVCLLLAAFSKMHAKFYEQLSIYVMAPIVTTFVIFILTDLF